MSTAISGARIASTIPMIMKIREASPPPPVSWSENQNVRRKMSLISITVPTRTMVIVISRMS